MVGELTRNEKTRRKYDKGLIRKTFRLDWYTEGVNLLKITGEIFFYNRILSYVQEVLIKR